MSIQNEVTSAVIATAIIAGQTPVRAEPNGCLVLGFQKNTQDVSNVRPGENIMGFSLIDISRGFASNMAVSQNITKILTSGNLFGKDGTLNPALIQETLSNTNDANALAELQEANAFFVQVDKTPQSVQGVNKFLAKSLSKNAEWAKRFNQRANRLAEIAKVNNSAILNGAVQEVSNLKDLIRKTNNNYTIDQYKEGSQMSQ